MDGPGVPEDKVSRLGQEQFGVLKNQRLLETSFGHAAKVRGQGDDFSEYFPIP